MAGVSPNPPQGSAVTSQLWSQARNHYFETAILAPDEKSFLESCSHVEVIKELRAWERRHAQRDRIRIASTRLRPLFSGLERYGRALDVLAQTEVTGVLSLIWGGIRLVLVVAKDFDQFFETICTFLGDVGYDLERFDELKDLTSAPRFDNALLEVFKALLEFNYVVFDVIKRNRQASTRVLGRSTFRGNIDGIKAQIEKIRRSCENVEKESRLAVQQTLVQWTRDTDERLEGMRRRQQDSHVTAVNTWDSMQNAEMRAGVNQWLEPVDTKEDYLRILKDPHRQNCQWIDVEPGYVQWSSCTIAAAEPMMLWIAAKAGTGKTYTFARILETLRASRTWAYFFCNSSDLRKRDEKYIYKTWLVHLLRQTREQDEHFEYLNEKRIDGQYLQISDLQDLILAIAENHRCWFALDGLDECSLQTRASLSNFLHRLSSKAKVLVTSRAELDITSSMRQLNGRMALVEINPNVNSFDLQNYLSIHLTSAFSKLGVKDPDLERRFLNEISSQADGMFMWVRLMIEQLADQVSFDGLEDAMVTPPLGLNDVYRRVLLRVNNFPTPKRTLSTRILRLVTCAMDPLTLKQFENVLRVNVDPISGPLRLIRPRETILECGASLVEVVHVKDKVRDIDEFVDKTKEVARIVHSSAVQFLVETAHQADDLRHLAINELDAHNFIARSCLMVLSDHPWEYVDQYGFLEVPFHVTRRQVEARPFLVYAAQYWWRHVQRSGIDAKLLSDLEAFVRSERRTVYWLQLFCHHSLDMAEAISTLQELSSASESGRVETWISHIHGPEPHRLTHARWILLLELRTTYILPIHIAAIFDFADMVRSELISLQQLTKSELESIVSVALCCAACSNASSCCELLMAELRGIQKFKIPYIPQCRPPFAGAFSVLTHWVIPSAVRRHSTSPLTRAKQAVGKSWGGTLLCILFGIKTDLEAERNDERTPLASAITSGPPSVIKLLIRAGAKLNSQNSDGSPGILHMAATHNPRALQILLLCKLTPDVADVEGNTPLHMAASAGSDLSIRLLIERGASLDSRNNNGLTPFDLALHNGHHDVLGLLGGRIDTLHVPSHRT